MGRLQTISIAARELVLGVGRLGRRRFIAALLLCGCTVAGETVQAADIRIVNNNLAKTITLSDLYSFKNKNNTGAKTTYLKKKDKADDVNLAPGAGKNYGVGADKSITVSFMTNGKEFEYDFNLGALPDWIKTLAMFDAPMGDVHAVDFADGDGALPALDSVWMVEDGHITDPLYDWFTFYDTSASDGFIVRDSLGYPISPLLDAAEVIMDATFQVSLVPEPATLAMLALGGLGGLLRRRI